MLNVKATEKDTTVKGSEISGENVNLEANENIDIIAGENKNIGKGDNSSSSASIGVSIDFSGISGINAGYNKANGEVKENAETHVASTITAQDTLATKSGQDTNIIGSKLEGETIKMEVGKDLNIESLQDKETYDEKNNSSGFNFSVDVSQPKGKPATYENAGITGGKNKGKTNSNYESVTDQAGIYAGKGGFDIEVGKNTDLKGVVIASEADASKNKLSTDTLTYSDIENKAEYESSSSGINVNTKPNAKDKDKGITPNIGVTSSDEADSTTKSAIAEGTIEIRSNPDQDLTGLSRDTQNSLNTLEKIFDRKTVAEQQELAQLFGEVAFKAIGDLGLKEGSPEKAALDMVLGGIMSKVGGGKFAEGAASAGLTQLVMNELKNIKDPALLQWATAIVGAAAAKVVGGNAQTGASVAVSEVRNNRLSHIVTDTAEVYEGLKYGLKDQGIETIEAFKSIIEHSIDTMEGIGSVIADIWKDPSIVKEIGENALQGIQDRFDNIADGSAYATGYEIGRLSVDLGLTLLDVGIAEKLVQKVLRFAEVFEVLGNERGAIRVFGNIKDATAAAKDLGFQKIDGYSHGQPVYKKSNLYITPDVDSHNGGVWKAARSVEDLGSKKTRLGTYDAELNWIGD